MAKVFLGVGHGGKDSGAVGNGFLEKAEIPSYDFTVKFKS